MWFTSRFGDFPQRAPDGPVTDPDSLFTGWMPLSYRAKATASSTLEDFAADRATDEDPRTFWVAADNNAGQTLTLDLGALKTVQAVQVNYADYQSGHLRRTAGPADPVPHPVVDRRPDLVDLRQPDELGARQPQRLCPGRAAGARPLCPL
jgi:hypothetical protein